jgi:hypothetical protein
MVIEHIHGSLFPFSTVQVQHLQYFNRPNMPNQVGPPFRNDERHRHKNISNTQPLAIDDFSWKNRPAHCTYWFHNDLRR